METHFVDNIIKKCDDEAVVRRFTEDNPEPGPAESIFLEIEGNKRYIKQHRVSFKGAKLDSLT